MNKSEEIKKHFQFFEKELLPTILQTDGVLQKKDGWQGLTSHTRGVVFRGIDFALSLNKDPIPVIFACALHDITKRHDSEKDHEKKALPIAKKIMKKYEHILSEDTQEKILNAIKNHTDGEKAPDYISACLWDADRTRVAWVFGYQEKYFQTERGKEIASSDAKSYLKYQSDCLNIPSEDKELIEEHQIKVKTFLTNKLIDTLKKYQKQKNFFPFHKER